MNLIEQATHQSTMQLISTYRDQALNLQNSACHQEDDVFEIGFKVNKVPISNNFKGFIREKNPFGKSVVSYVRKDFSQWMSRSDYRELTEDQKELYTPVFKIFCSLNENTWIEYCNNIITFRIDKLAYVDGSRFKLMLDEVINSMLILPRHRSEEITRKLEYNALRNILIRHAYIKRYEWAYLLDANVSKVLYTCLVRLANEKKYVNQCQNTFYLKTGKDSNFSLKIYDIDCALGTPRQDNPAFLDGDRLKMEITYHREYFVRNHISLNKLTSPDKIAMLLHDSNAKNVTKLFDKLKPEEKRAMMIASYSNTQSEFMSKIFDSKTRLAADNQYIELMRKIDKLQSLVEKQNDDIASIKEFIGMNAKKDVRKLRLVK